MANQLKIDNITFSVGDTVRVYLKIQEGEKVRIQPFEGTVMAIKGRGGNKMFTVRKIAAGGIGVERIWSAYSPWIQKIEVKKKGKVRRAKLYYLRKKVGKKAAKIREKRERLTKRSKRDDRAERGRNHAERDEEKRPRRPRRKTGRQTAKKE